MSGLDDIRQTFFLECEELLEELESGLLTLSEGAGDAETINATFRAVHSIKGGAGAFALDALVKFAHKFETTLDEVRAGRLEASDDVTKVFLRCADVLTDLVAAARDGADADMTQADELIEELNAFGGGDNAPEQAESEPVAAEPDEEDADFTPMSIDIDLDLPTQDDESAGFTIRFRPKPELYANGNDTGLLLRALSDLGEMRVACNDSNLPLLDELDPEGAYLEWSIDLTSCESETVILEIFEFAADDCELDIKPKPSGDDPRREDADGFQPATLSLDDIAITETAAASAEENEPDAAPLATADADANKTPPAAPAPEPALKTADEAKAKTPVSASKATIRVDLERIDRLINLVGELVINQAMLSESIIDAGVSPNSTAGSGLDELKQLTREIQQSVMAIRAQPVKSLFQRMSRIVREASSATGKSVRLQTDGEATEVDKTVIERLSDPLTHMIRNAVDHGLEDTEQREAAGKPKEGVVRLTAAHRSGRVVIEIADDGGGINRERVKQIAIDKNLIPGDARLTNSEIDNLLFMPGFSTAQEVSNLSGRGVGMDVVKRAIQALGGRISISSTPGEGSTFSISLPLTLAVVDGMVVNVAEQTVVVPLTSVVETLKPPPSDIHAVAAGGNVVFVRSEFVPIVDVGHELGYRDANVDFSDCVLLLVEKDNGVRNALAVDMIQDQRQVVIKGLEDNYGSVPGVAAATILGDGQIALILDTDTLVKRDAPMETELTMAG